MDAEVEAPSISDYVEDNGIVKQGKSHRKWRCLHPNCGKEFKGEKIRPVAHVAKKSGYNVEVCKGTYSKENQRLRNELERFRLYL